LNEEADVVGKVADFGMAQQVIRALFIVPHFCLLF
jgi:hypothetical protein